MTIVNKIIHRFVRPRYEYMSPEGELYSQIIPVNTQAYSYECIDKTNPNNPNSYIIRYVLGTGGSTYAQIAEGRGKDKDGNIIPELSKEFVLRSDPQLIKLITQLIKEQVVFASYLTSDVENNPFATKADLDNAEVYYVNGEEVTPTINDYVIVLSDESRETGSGEYPTTRYVCVDIVEDKPVWAFQYQINNGNFTPEQQAAIDSGITTEKVALYDSWEDKIAEALDHISNKENPHNVTAEQIGLGNVDNTSDLDKPVSNATQEALDSLNNNINEHIENTQVHVTPTEKETWNSKQDALKVGNHIEIKNDTISVLDDLSTYDNRASGFVNKDVDDLYNYYTKAELDKYLVGGTYKYSGEVATYDDLPFSLIEIDEAYYKLLWVNANRLQYIDTKHQCNQNTKIILRVKLNRGDNYLYSTKMNEPNKVGLAVNYGANTGVAYFGNKEIQLDIASLKDTETEIILSKDGVFIDGEQVGAFGEIEEFTTESTLFVPKWNSPDTHSMNLNVYAFQILNDNIILKDFIPVARKYDEVPGLYDKLAKKFYRSELKSEDETIIVDFIAGEYESSVVSGTVYKVLDENSFYMWYKNKWINVAELHKAGIGISIDKDGTINNIDDIIVNGESQFDKNRVADLTKHFDQKIDHYINFPKITEENSDIVVQYVGTTIGDYIQNYFYKAIYDPRHPENSHWERVNVQPETDLEPVWEAIEELDHKKVDKTHEAFKIYGTDKDGNQTYYDKEDFGKVDDVRLNGVSVVGIKEEKVADIDLVASDSEYHNDAVSSITNVQQALDNLMNIHYYVNPSYTTFTVDHSGNYDVGTVLSQPFTVTWVLNKQPESGDVETLKYESTTLLNIMDLEDHSKWKSGTYTYTNNITSNSPKTYTFRVDYTDNHSTVPSGKTGSCYATRTFNFMYRRYWGVTSTETLSDEQLYALSNELSTSRAQERDFNCTGGKYWWFVIPTTYCSGIQFTDVGSGLPMTLPPECISSRTITNSQGISYSVNVYRGEFKQTASSVKIKVS